MSCILITGGSGFIGSHMSKLLCEKHPNQLVVNADAFTYAARSPMWEETPKNFMNIRMDIRDQAAVRTLFEHHRPHTVFHFAAESHVCRSIAGPKDFATTNMMGTFNLVEEARKFGSQDLQFVHISTDEVFGEITEGQFNESSPYQPRSPYSASKAAADMLVRAWRETFKLKAVVINMCNVFGPNQHTEKLIPMTISKILHGKDVIVHGTGENRREWLFVENAIEAIWRSVRHPGENFCLGGGVETSNLEMIRLIHSMLREELPELQLELKLRHTDDRPTDDRRYAIDCNKAKTWLQWDNGQDLFRENLKKTVQWYVGAILNSGGTTSHGRGG